jgi:Tol biopolymer transport system component
MSAPRRDRYTPELAVDYRVPSDPRLSPDGTLLAFVVAPIGHKETERTAALCVVPTDGSAAPRAVTGGEHHNTAPRWSPDGTTLAFLSDRPKRGEQQLSSSCTASRWPVANRCG